MAAKKPTPTKGQKTKKSAKEPKARELSEEELSTVAGGAGFGTLTDPLVPQVKDLNIRQLTEKELFKVAGGIRMADQGGKSRQTVCR